MPDPLPFSLTVLSATLLCSLVAGFLFAFAVVVMPGLKKLNDREFIHTFQVIDGVIQNRQPIFMVVWAGSIVALVASAVLAMGHLDGYERLFMYAATITYLLGVQCPTLAINIPLNNALQSVAIHTTDATQLKTARENFEPRWNRWNAIRTTFAILTSVQLLVLLFWL